MKRVFAEEEAVRLDRDSLYIGNLNTVEFDLTLPKKGQYGSEITWESGHERLLTSEGKVTRPTYGMGDRVVPLLATFRFGSAVATKTFEVRILEEENKLCVKSVYPVKAVTQAGEKHYLPQAAIVETPDGDTIPYPVSWEGEGSVCFDSPGEYQAEGFLTGTKVPVIARIRAVETLEKKKSDPQMRVQECRSARIRLLEGSEFYNAQERMKEFLLSVDDEQMLYNFRKASGLDTRGASPMEGWDSPDSQLRGHTTGHYMSALALCYHATGEKRIKEKALYMVKSMRECQKAFSDVPGIQEGFLSGYSEEQFDLLEEYTPYPTIWAPYYTLHKIFAGLLDCYQYVQAAEALEISEKLGQWVCRRLKRLTHEQLGRMWSMYIAGEFGGMNAVMAQLYRLTGKEEFLSCARLFDNDKLFYPLKEQVDALSTMHANQHIPQILGAMELYKATGEEEFFEISEFFWRTVTGFHSYATGGTGEGEMFHERNKIGALLTKNTEETCASYNMLKLTKELYQYQPKASYMDYYETTVLNHILSTQDRRATGESTYFLPLGPGMKKEFLCENSCCHGTGMESHFKYREGIYFYDADTIYLNLFIPSEMWWEDRDVLIRLEDTAFSGTFRVFVKGAGLRTLKFRKPAWAREHRILEGKETLDMQPDENGYLQIGGDFSGGREYELTFSYHFQILRTPDRPEMAALRYGPYIMAVISEEQDFIPVSFDESDVDTKMKREEGLGFVCDGRRWIPLNQVENEAYHVYFICKIR
ncbi:beta-L-arabinofuranosidase domain-containing protein [Roseburia hominis]